MQNTFTYQTTTTTTATRVVGATAPEPLTSAIGNTPAEIPTHVERPAIVEDSSFGYRAGMKTEVRIAPRWGNAVSDYLRHLRALNRSEATVYLRSYQLRSFSQAFRGRSPWTLTMVDIEAYLATRTTLGNDAKRGVLIAIRGFYQWGLRAGHITVDPTLGIGAIAKTEGRPRPASDAAIREAMDRAEPRVKMMIMLGAYCGLRRHEIAKVHTTDLVERTGGRHALKVVGKGKKTRFVPLTPFMASMIQDAPFGYLFPSWHRGQINSDGRVHDKPLTAGTVGDLVARALPDGVTPHMLRHRFASSAYATKHDIRAVQTLLGHASVATTQTYTAVEDDSLYDAVVAAGELRA